MNSEAMELQIISSAQHIADILKLSRWVARISNRDITSKYSVSGITPAMDRLLGELEQGGSQTVPTLATSLATGRQHVQRLVNKLMAQGFVERMRNSAHKRSWLICLTDLGYIRVNQLGEIENTIACRLSSRVSEEDLRLCLRTLRVLAEHVGNERGGDREFEIKKSKLQRKDSLMTEKQNSKSPIGTDQHLHLENMTSTVPMFAIREKETRGAFVSGLNWNGGSGLKHDTSE